MKGESLEIKARKNHFEMDRLSYILEKAVQKEKEVVIDGDFNCNMLNQDLSRSKQAEIMSVYNLTQLVNSPMYIPELPRAQ